MATRVVSVVIVKGISSVLEVVERGAEVVGSVEGDDGSAVGVRDEWHVVLCKMARMETMSAIWEVSALDGEPVSYWGYLGDPAVQLAFASIGKCLGGWVMTVHDGRDSTRSLSRLYPTAERGMAVAERWARPRREALAARRSKGLPVGPSKGR